VIIERSSSSGNGGVDGRRVGLASTGGSEDGPTGGGTKDDVVIATPPRAHARARY
jgi:hypothetical protein